MQFSILLRTSVAKRKIFLVGNEEKSNIKQNLLLINSQAHSLPKQAAIQIATKKKIRPVENVEKI
jgi:hypothetical protein